MVKVEFKLNGRTVHLNEIADQLEKAMFEQVRKGIQQKLRGIRDPETGAAPTIHAIGRSIGDFSFEVSGSPALVEEVQRRLR